MGWRIPGSPCPSPNIPPLLASIVSKKSSLEDQIQYCLLPKDTNNLLMTVFVPVLPGKALWREKGEETQQNLEKRHWENWKQTTHFPNFQGLWNFQNVASKGSSDSVLQYNSVVEKFLMSCLWLASKKKTYLCKATGVGKNEQMQGDISMGTYRKKVSSLVFRKLWHTWKGHWNPKNPHHTKN